MREPLVLTPEGKVLCTVRQYEEDKARIARQRNAQQNAYYQQAAQHNYYQQQAGYRKYGY